VLCLEHGILPQPAGHSHPRAALRLCPSELSAASPAARAPYVPLVVYTEPRALADLAPPAAGGHLYAGVSSFGIGQCCGKAMAT